VIETAAQSPAGAVEHVGADILGVIPDHALAVAQGGHVRRRLDVVDAGAIEVVLGADDEAELLASPKAPAPGAVHLRVRTDVFDGRVAADGGDLVGRGVARGLGDEIDLAADAVAVHASLLTL